MVDARLAAARYAEALSQAVPDGGEFQRIIEDLKTFARLDAQSEELRKALASPVIPASSKIRVIEEIASRLDADPRLARLLAAMARNHRLTLIGEVARAAAALADRRSGVYEVELRSARPLETTERDRLEQSIRSIVGGDVRLTEEIDEDLLGGIVARVGAVVFDGSLKTKLSRLRSHVVGGAEGRAAV